MFLSLDPISEDPATGSAVCAPIGLLSCHDEAANAEFAWRVVQGVEMGRPSLMRAQTLKADGVLTDLRLGGDCVMISGELIEVG